MELIDDSLARSRRSDMLAVVEEMARHHPEEPHWYLPLIGVEPARQGYGLGAVLLRAALLRCDAARELPAYLKSTNPRNRLPAARLRGCRRDPGGRLSANRTDAASPQTLKRPHGLHSRPHGTGRSAPIHLILELTLRPPAAGRADLCGDYRALALRRLERFPHDVGHFLYPACLK